MRVVDELVAGRYELEELIGSGAMASVYSAHDRRLERRVALKILHEHWSRESDYIERFRREARAVAQLNHPNIVTVIDRGSWQGREHIVFEYVDGENLKQLLERSGMLPVGRALELAIEIGRGLAFAHHHGLIHRDVKPQNVLISQGGAKVTDFGIAHMAGLAELTEAGTIIGTSDYIAPEQANGQPASEQSDIYSLGAVLFELLTGEVPFRGDGVIAVAMRHVTDPAPNVLERRPELPPRVATAVARALEKDPQLRHSSMVEFVAELSACLDSPAHADDSTMMLAREATGKRGRTRRRPRPRMAVSIGLPLLAAVIGAAYVVFSTHSSNPIAAQQALGAAVTLRAVTAYDPPPGDGVEDNEHLPLATDGNPATYWATEWYSNPQFGNLKRGVGIVLDAGKPAHISTLTVQSDTPGFIATIEAGRSQTGPFQPVSPAQTVEGRTTFRLRRGPANEYYLLWISQLSPDTGPNYQAHINEISAS